MELHATIHEDDDGMFWAQVKELPGCFASGSTWDELMEALIEAVEMCLPTDQGGGSGRKGSRPPMRVDEMKLVSA